MALTYPTTRFFETVCLIKLLEGEPAAAKKASWLPGMTVSSADWPLRKLTPMVDATGLTQWEKNWVSAAS